MLTIVGGSAAAQVAVLAARPVLTRLYPPEAFGLLTLFLAIVALSDTVSSGRYEDAVLLPSDDRRAGHVLLLALRLVAMSSVLVGLGVAAWVLGPWPPANPIVWSFLPLGTLAAGILMVSVRWHARRERFGLISAARGTHGLTGVSVQLAAGIGAGGTIGLVGGAVAGGLAAALVAGVALLRHDGAWLRAGYAPLLLRRVARRYRRFPQYAAPANLLKGLASRVAVLALAPFGAATIGFFGVAYGTLALPLDLLGAAVAEVFFVRAAVAHRESALAALTSDTLRRLVLLCALPCGLVVAAGPDLFGFVFGETWREAGTYARWLAPWILLSVVAQPLTTLFDVLERQRLDLGVAGVLFGGQLMGLLLGGWLGGALGAIIGVSVAGTLLRLGHIGVMLRLAGAPLKPALRSLAEALAGTLLFAGPVALGVWVGAGSLALLALCAVGALGYYARLHRSGLLRAQKP